MSGNDDKIESGYVGVQDPDVLVNLEPAKPYQVKSPLLRECIAEFLGTMVMIMFGDGVVAQVVLSEGTKGEYININLCWGLGVLFGIHVSGGVSGAHLNPAVTTTLAWFGRMEWKKVPYYIISQILGAFAAAFIVWVVYYPMFNVIDPEKTSTQGVFATYPYSNDVPNPDDVGDSWRESTCASRHALRQFPSYGVAVVVLTHLHRKKTHHQIMHRESVDKMDGMLRVSSMPKMESNYMGEPDVAMMSTGPAHNGVFQTKSPLFRECMAEFLGMRRILS
ncbi:hypothetical protein PF003_g7743 [Phytophthora fragariae]|nr:hypothetical protein PF003_g7743 [Phytophthora fragariae]